MNDWPLFYIATGEPLNEPEARHARDVAARRAWTTWLSDLHDLHPAYSKYTPARRIPTERIARLETAGALMLGDAFRNESAILALTGIGPGTVDSLRGAYWGIFYLTLELAFGVTPTAPERAGQPETTTETRR